MLEGKGIYLWRINNVEGGDPTAIAEAARAAGLTHVLVKVADGRGTYNTYKMENGQERFNRADGVDQVPGVVAALRARGIKVWGWQYIYGHYPQLEARIAIRRTQQFELDGFVVNAEIEFQQKGMDAPARTYMAELRANLPNTPIALSSFRYHSVHSAFPWETFLEYCDLHMPQVYWVGANNPGEQLARCLREFQGLRVWRPIIPTGAAYGEHGWRATPEQVTAFLHAVRENQLPACNFWEWYFARQNDSALWNPIKNFAWPTSQAGQPADIAIRYIEALNSNDPVKVAALYNPGGVHVTAQRTVQGSQALLGWYNQLLGQTLPSARFQVTGSSQTDNIRTISWSAESSNGRVLDGRDSLAVKDDRIAYHYTYFTVQNN